MPETTSQSTQIRNKIVFINCPYDEEYKDILHILIFLVATFGCTPTIASENKESSDRMSKIMTLIHDSQIGIHDISRMEHTTEDPLARFNMPFELGIDYAHKYYCSEGNKKLLILQEKPFLSKRTLSDLSGLDIEAHDNKIGEVVKIVRSFFCSIFSLTNVISPSRLETEYYTGYHARLREKLLSLGFNEKAYLEEMSISEYIRYALEYVSSVGTKY
ncbi:MAG: hypothetical protein ABH890_04355 [Bacillota bacterium]